MVKCKDQNLASFNLNIYTDTRVIDFSDGKETYSVAFYIETSNCFALQPK